MRPQPRLPLTRARRDRGFSLMELGIVLAVAAVLMMGVASTIQGLTRYARASRTVSEVSSLLTVGQNLAVRSLSINLTSGSAKYFLGSQQLNDTTPFPIDLSTISSGEHYDKLKELIGTQTGLSNDGRSAYLNPYVLLFTTRRVEVQTCVDEFDYEDYSAFKALATCTRSCPGTDKCVSLSGPLVSLSGQRTRYSYDPTLFMP